jgi:hypothetical protein
MGYLPTGPREGDRVLRPVNVLWICDFAIVGGDRHDLLGSELLFPLVLGGGSPTEDGGDGLGGILVSKACISPVLRLGRHLFHRRCAMTSLHPPREKPYSGLCTLPWYAWRLYE